MQLCPLCNTQYNDIAKVCPLEHCTNCGSLELQKMRSRNLSKFDRSQLTSLVGMLGIMSFLIAFATVDKYGYVTFAGAALVTGIPAVLFYIIKSNKIMECKSCKAKKFGPLTNIQVQKGLQSEDGNPPKNKVTTESKSDTIDNLIRIQDKSNKRNFIIQIFGTIGIFVGIVVAIWLSHPEFFSPRS